MCLPPYYIALEIQMLRYIALAVSNNFTISA